MKQESGLFPLLILWLATLSGACTTCQTPYKMELIGDIRSGFTMEEVRKHTTAGLHSWAPGYEKKIDSSARGPFFHEQWERIEEFQDLGELGVLEIEFINDKVVTTSFYPRDLSSYLNNLAHLRGVDLIHNETIECQYRMITKGKNLEKGEYVLWKDLILDSEAQELARHYD